MSKLPYKNYKNKSKKFHNQKNYNISNINESGFTFNSNINDEQIEPEWMKPETKKIENINQRFHKEILDYVNYITPKNETLTARQNTFNLFTKIVEKYRPDWKVFLFGSFSQNISTVFSDLDFLIVYGNKNSSQEYDIKEMYNLMNFLKKEEFSQNIRLAKARVPVLRATCTSTGINIDISINRENGCQAVEAIQKIIKKYKILRPSIITLKILLKKFNLNDPHSGGMNSFLLFHLVYFFFIQKLKEKNKDNNLELNNEVKIEDNNNSNKQPKDNLSMIKNNNTEYEKENELNYNKDNHEDYKEDNNNISNKNYKEEKNCTYEGNIGNFIILFLNFYGNEFDYKKYSLSLNGNNLGKMFLKDQRKDIECSNTISIESIIEKGKDVGNNCYNYPIIVKLFKAAYNMIQSEKEKDVCSILQSLGFPSL